jgi:hypothetical protein
VDLSGVRAAPLRDRRVADALSDAARAPRALRIETQPDGARVEIAYLRDGVELVRGAGAAPLVAQLPALARAGERDRLQVRAKAAGFATAERSLAARSAEPALRFTLAPLPPSVFRASLLELADVAELRIASDRELRARLAATTRGDRLVFADVARARELAVQLAALRGAAISRVDATPLGTDLAVELERAPGYERHELRLTAHAEASGSHVLLVRWTPLDAGEALRAGAALVLASLHAADVSGCALVFERELRASVGGDAIARALAVEHSLSRWLVAPALLRVGELSPPGALTLVDGTRLEPERELESKAALARVAELHGALAAIRALTSALAPRGAGTSALHAWLAPDLPDAAFASALERAVAAERRCAARP